MTEASTPPATSGSADEFFADLHVHFPGTAVPFSETANKGIIVYPVPFSEIRNFGKGLEEFIGLLIKVKSDPDGKLNAEVLTASFPQMSSSLLSRIEQMVQKCIVGYVKEGEVLKPVGSVPLDRLPTPFLPKVLSAWIEESFSADKLRPWIEAIEKTVQKITGRSATSVWETFSHNSSPRGTDTLTSSTPTDPVGRTPDGASPSTTHGQDGSLELDVTPAPTELETSPPVSREP